MSKRLFAYTPAELDEAEHVRRLLDEHHIDYYETPASPWGFSKAAIWLHNDDDLARAKTLLRQYENEYARQARQRYQAETGYDPQARFPHNLLFLLGYWYRKRHLLPWVVLGFILIYLYFHTFFGLFA